MEKTTENKELKTMIKFTIKNIVKELAQIDQLIDGIEDYNKLNEIDNQIFFEVEGELIKVFDIIEKEG